MTGFRGSVAAEWTKLWTVRSTWACLAASAALVSLFAVITGVSGRGQHAHGAAGAPMSAPGAAATGVLYLGEFAILALATLVVAGEYATGSIRGTLSADPVRYRMLAAKGAVLLPVVFAAGVVLGLLGTAVATVAMGRYADPLTPGGVAGRAAAIGGYLALVSVLTVGIGAAVRSVAGTLTVSFLLILVLPMAMTMSGVSVLATVGTWFPGPAGMTLLGAADSGPSYGAAGAVPILAAWALAGLAAGATVLHRRDA